MKKTHIYGFTASLSVLTAVSCLNAFALSLSLDDVFEDVKNAVTTTENFLVENQVSWLNDDSNIFSLILSQYDSSQGKYVVQSELFFSCSSIQMHDYSADYYISQYSATKRIANGLTTLITDPNLKITVYSYRIEVPYVLTGTNQSYWYFVDEPDNITYNYIVTYCDIPEVQSDGQQIISTFKPNSIYLDNDLVRYNTYFDTTRNNLTNIYNSFTEQPVQTGTQEVFTLPPSWLNQTTATVPIPSIPATLHYPPSTVTEPDPNLAHGLQFWKELTADIVERFRLLPILLFVLSLAIAGYIIF